MTSLIRNFDIFLRTFFTNKIVALFLFLFTFVFYIRLDAELMILLSVLLVLFTIWNSLTEMLSVILSSRSTLYYYYLIRFYQARMWTIYLSYKLVSVHLYSTSLPYYFKWFKLYSQRLNRLVMVQGEDLLLTWNNLINFFAFVQVKLVMSSIWAAFYKSYINLYFVRELEFNFDDLNMRKLSEYCVLNSAFFE
jgi:hypothetical protein